ncbi:putative chitinase [Nitrobacteraceae bacterium AZCC 2161]
MRSIRRCDALTSWPRSATNAGQGTIVREDMNYRAERIGQIFGVHSAKVTPAEAERLAHNPKALAERVYGLGNPKWAKEPGNTQPGDGYR